MDLGDDEVLLLVLSAILGFLSLKGWLSALRLCFRWNNRGAGPVIFIPLSCLAFVSIVLGIWADDEVRSSAIYIFILLLLMVGWLGLATFLFRWLGVSLLDDAVDRNNRAALIAWSGGIIAVTLVFAGGNTGEGPSLWNNVFSALLGTAGIVVAWFLLETFGRVSSSVAVDRDVATGVRLGGFLVATGLIFGRSVAGDWVSSEDTVHDFLQQGWPALLVSFIAILLERFCRPSPGNACPSWLGYGLPPALVYVIAASAVVGLMGTW